MSAESGMSAIAAELLLQHPPIPLLGKESSAPPLIHAIEHNLLLRSKRNDLWLPNLAHKDIKSILVLSDYGGEHPKAKFTTYSFLLAGYQLIQPVLDKLKDIRRRNGLMKPFREVCFKELRYGPIGRSIPAWLHAADAVAGLLFTLVVPRTVHSLIGPDDKETPKDLAKMMDDEGFPQWKGTEAEKILRIVHVLGYLVGLLSRPGQDAVWISDNDSILANRVRVEQVKKLFSIRLSQYGHGEYRNVALGLPFERKKETYSVCDLLSIPDLAAGSIQAILAEEPKGAKARIHCQADKVLLWLCHQSVYLKKLTVHVRTGEGGKVEVASTCFIPIYKQERKTIPVVNNPRLGDRVLNELKRKIGLSLKYGRLVRIAGSLAKRQSYGTKAKKYQKQAANLLWHGKGRP